MSAGAQIHVTNRNGSCTTHYVLYQPQLVRVIERAYARRLVAVARMGGEVFGGVEKNPEGRWVWWYDETALPAHADDRNREVVA